MENRMRMHPQRAQRCSALSNLILQMTHPLTLLLHPAKPARPMSSLLHTHCCLAHLHPPTRSATMPVGANGMTCRPKAADTPSSAPSSIITLAPPLPSSAGWNSRRTVPRRLPSTALSRLAAAGRGQKGGAEQSCLACAKLLTQVYNSACTGSAAAVCIGGQLSRPLIRPEYAPSSRAAV